MLTHSIVDRRELMGEGDNSGGIGKDDVYIDNGEKVVLALLSNLYSELDAISVGTSRPSSYSTLYCLLTIFLLV